MQTACKRPSLSLGSVFTSMALCSRFGEGFDYQSTSADYFLIEASGIAFGVPGDMSGEIGKCANPNPW